VYLTLKRWTSLSSVTSLLLSISSVGTFSLSKMNRTNQKLIQRQGKLKLMESLIKQKRYEDARNMYFDHFHGKPMNKETFARLDAISIEINRYTRLTALSYNQSALGKTVKPCEAESRCQPNGMTMKRSIPKVGAEAKRPAATMSTPERALEEAESEIRYYGRIANKEKAKLEKLREAEDDETLNEGAARNQKMCAQRVLIAYSEEIRSIESFGNDEMCARYADAYKEQSDLFVDAIQREKTAAKNLKVIRSQMEASYKAASEAMKIVSAAEERRKQLLAVIAQASSAALGTTMTRPISSGPCGVRQMAVRGQTSSAVHGTTMTRPISSGPCGVRQRGPIPCVATENENESKLSNSFNRPKSAGPTGMKKPSLPKNEENLIKEVNQSNDRRTVQLFHEIMLN
jgi:hypothetical protein